ncbi:PTS lactose/cellobiose transporter subunit IIA [Acetonema longum]|uniref:PTS system, lactose/cellobiose-specific family, IIA component n=1 Tax=Acetonema longum DSM 6540 TaxID=1009370 RepID=F7NMV2_9FIRM|nr:PTS lactose/cellobiose transporter subunit IIA [Acetonema longum]EGO62646.1 PTS system, lactose/cellobiose-specific family, IIA component [Acetonema longum DSM 6540]
MEEVAVKIILESGDARSCAMEAIQCAKSKDFAKAKELMEQCNEKISRAHVVQTGLIQAEASGKKTELSVLLIHAQDHLMTSITVKDLANEIIELYTHVHHR